MTNTELKQEIHHLLGDFALSETDYISVPEIISEVREIVGDTVAPYRWSESLLLSLATNGIKEIIAYRSDCYNADVERSYNEDGGVIEVTTTLPVRFHGALVHYVANKAFSGDAEDQADTAQRNFHLQQYNDALASVSYRWNDERLERYIKDGVKEITEKRPDVLMHAFVVADGDTETVALPDYLKDSLIDYVLMRCYEMRINKKGEAEKFSYYQQKYITETYGSLRR